ncbi:hypothetical protein AAHE18_09G204900 [Arachis hypogaea]
MAQSSSSASLFGFRGEDQNQMKEQHSLPPSSSTTSSAPPQQKKKRNQPGTPNPDAEVIALSPKTLMATNRFICEVCNKGFQREQNLQLHRRGHNLPWKLKQKTTKEPKRKVYLCPEPTCVHHDPSRALGDLTGIKKHYSRKHGEKKWKCDKCSKKYAVQSDWKAHSKTCGTREYRCDCGTLFSRRDSFITHRAFCDALAQESARQPPNLNNAIGTHLYGSTNNNMALGLSQHGNNNNNNEGNNSFFTGAGGSAIMHQTTSSTAPSLFSNSLETNNNNNNSGSISHMSATALLQKAAQMGATTSNSTASLLKSFGVTSTTSAAAKPPHDHHHHLRAATMVSNAAAAASYGSIFGSGSEQGNLQDLMNSFATVASAGHSSSMFESGGGSSVGLMAGFDHAYDHSSNSREHKLHGVSIGGGSDGLTRDFLGVGQMVRTMSSGGGGGGGGVSRREQQQQHCFTLSSMEAERNSNAAPSGQSFGSSGGGGGNFQ